MYLCRLKDFKEPEKWEHVLGFVEQVAICILLEDKPPQTVWSSRRNPSCILQTEELI